MKPLALAAKNLRRHPARTLLAVMGISVVGALLFDMILLSRGLVSSFDDLLESVPFDIRVTQTAAWPTVGPKLREASVSAERLRGLGEVAAVVPLLSVHGVIVDERERFGPVGLIGTEPAASIWTLKSGRLSFEEGEALINQALVDAHDLDVGSTFAVRRADSEVAAVRREVPVVVAGVVSFTFESRSDPLAAVSIDLLRRIGEDPDRDEADFLLVASSAGRDTEATLRAVRRSSPELHAFSNADYVRRFERESFSYFRQISRVLSAITLFFTILLVATLLTVSVNQRRGEVAILCAVGIARAKIARHLVWEALLVVGAGALLALPLGGALSVVLDRILSAMPGLPVRLQFFVFEARAVAVHLVALGAAAVVASIYPVWLAARIRIAPTLRREAS